MTLSPEAAEATQLPIAPATQTESPQHQHRRKERLLYGDQNVALHHMEAAVPAHGHLATLHTRHRTVEQEWS